MTRFLDATRERFLLAIAAVLPPERFIELHFFAPIRQAGVESGVAVVAAHPERLETPVLADAPLIEESFVAPDDSTVIPSEARELLLTRDDERQHPLAQVRARGFAPRDDKYTVYTAKYKLVLKGPDRGKWECTVIAVADAPLVTVETVVRGVQKRSGDTDEPERMSGDDARDYILSAARISTAR